MRRANGGEGGRASGRPKKGHSESPRCVLGLAEGPLQAPTRRLGDLRGRTHSGLLGPRSGRRRYLFGLSRAQARNGAPDFNLATRPDRCPKKPSPGRLAARSSGRLPGTALGFIRFHSCEVVNTVCPARCLLHPRVVCAWGSGKALSCALPRREG